jgi:mannose-1-phosphate guanylyltransferase
LGIRPLSPDTGFGYIKRGEVLEQVEGSAIFAVAQFAEKPDLATAKKYLQDGSYEWNAGMFFFRTNAMIEKFRVHAPDTFARLMAIRDAVDTPEYRQVLQEQFMDMEKVSIDYAILEKDAQIAVMPVPLHWSDVGSWSALKDMLPSQMEGNVSRGAHIDSGSRNCLVYADTKPIVTIGLKDIVVVQMDDVTLVCHRDQAQAVSPVVKSLADGEYQDLL